MFNIQQDLRGSAPLRICDLELLCATVLAYVKTSPISSYFPPEQKHSLIIFDYVEILGKCANKSNFKCAFHLVDLAGVCQSNASF